VGIVTARDHLTIHWTSQQVWTTVLNFSSLDPEIARQAYHLGNDVRDWKVTLAQEDLKKSGPNKNNIVPILYRPFDIRFTYYTGNSKGFHCMPRGEVMRHMLHDNIALITPRQFKEQPGAFVTACIAGHKTVSAFDINYFFPLYLYEPSGSGGSGRRTGFSRYQHAFVFEPAAAYSVRHPNISSNLLVSLAEGYEKKPTPEQLFHYIYALLYSNAYRKKYAEFLKSDFPRVPFTTDYELFKKLAERGEELVNLHLLKSKKVAKPITKCEGSGDLHVVKVTYDQTKARVHINPEKWFTGILPEVWEYHIGGYQVAEKWLKDRRGKGLSSEEVTHYAKVVTAIAETINIQETLDELFKEVETNLLQVKL
jgi:predicted helicase